MSVFGTNLLMEAFKLIPHEQIILRRFKEMTIRADGLQVPSYYDDELIEASVQAVPSEIYKQLNLDFQKSYIYVHTPNELKAGNQEEVPDRLVWNNRQFDVYQNVNWFAYNNWSSTMAVEVIDNYSEDEDANG